MAPPLNVNLTLSLGETVNIVYPTEDMDQDMYTNNVRATWMIRADQDGLVNICFISFYFCVQVDTKGTR